MVPTVTKRQESTRRMFGSSTRRSQSQTAKSKKTGTGRHTQASQSKDGTEKTETLKYPTIFVCDQDTELIAREARQLLVYDEFRSLESNNNYMVTKKDKVLDEVNEMTARDDTATFRTKMNTLNFRSRKMLMWRFVLYVDFIDEPPSFLKDPNSIHYLHVKYFNRRTIFKLDSSVNRDLV